MSQYSFGNLSSPLSGAALVDTHLEPWRDALHSLHAGSSLPSYAVAGMMWLDTTTNPWVLKVYDGSDSISLGTINTTTNQFTPSNVAIADGDKGDIVVSSTGTVWTIDSNAITTAKILDANVTLAKLATQAANTVLANATGSTAGPTAVALSAQQVLGRLGSNIVGVDIGTAANYRANASDKLLTADKVWSAAGAVGLTDAATIALDLSTGLNFSVTLGGSRTLGNPSNVKDGQTGYIKFTQDGTGTRVLSFGANWKNTSGKVLSTVAGTIDVLYYQIVGATPVVTGLVKGI